MAGSRGGLFWGVPAPGDVPGGDPPPAATAAGGTHPTGMHSCFILFSDIIIFSSLCSGNITFKLNSISKIEKGSYKILIQLFFNTKKSFILSTSD